MRFGLFALPLLALLFAASCGKDDEPGTSPLPSGEGTECAELRVEADVQSFDPGTRSISFVGEDVLRDSAGVLLNAVSFTLHGDVLFDNVPVVQPVESVVINDMVLFVGVSGDCRLLDGYPELDVLGDGRDAAAAARDEAAAARQSRWGSFVDYLREAGKLAE